MHNIFSNHYLLFQNSLNSQKTKKSSFAIFPSLSSNHYFSKPIVEQHITLTFCQCKTLRMPTPNSAFAQPLLPLTMFSNKTRTKKKLAVVQCGGHPSPPNPKLPMHLVLNAITMTTNIPNHYLPCMKSHMSNLLPHQQISNPLKPPNQCKYVFPRTQSPNPHNPHNVKPANLVHFASNPRAPKLGQKRKKIKRNV
jgi:hypothetical protein